MAKKFSVTYIEVNPDWIFDTFKGRIVICAKINGYGATFVFSAARADNPLFAGIDCNEAFILKNPDASYHYDKYDTVKISNCSTQTSYALHIGSQTLVSMPKVNQKDFAFVGRYYSTKPIKSAFKEKMIELYNNKAFTGEFANMFNLTW